MRIIVAQRNEYTRCQNKIHQAYINAYFSHPGISTRRKKYWCNEVGKWTKRATYAASFLTSNYH